MNYLSNFFVAIDQLGNVIAGGNPDNTISSRVGYYTEEFYEEDKIPAKWQIFKQLINFAFFPIDGEDHCKQAYYNDAGENFDEGTKDLAVAVLAILIIPSCIMIASLLYTLYALRIVSPRKVNRTKNIKHRLSCAIAKLKGVHTELNDYKVVVDDELNSIIENAEETIEEISQKIDGILNLKGRLKKYKLKKDDVGI